MIRYVGCRLPNYFEAPEFYGRMNCYGFADCMCVGIGWIHHCLKGVVRTGSRK